MKIYPLFLLFPLTLVLSAQQSPVIFESGALRASFGPGGALQSPDGEHFLSYKAAEGIYVPFAYEGGLLSAGIDASNNLTFHESRGTSNISGVAGETNLPVDHWRITREEIEQHRADFEDNGVIDNPIAAVFSWPARGNAFFEEYNGFEFVSLATSAQGVAEFWDLNQNGIYEPDAGDFPIHSIRGCVDNLNSGMIPAEMLFFPFVNVANTGKELEIQMTVLRFDCEDEVAVNNSIFIKYKIINRSVELINNNHFGFFMDGDIGCPTDDFMGTFPQRNVAYFYNGDAQDEGCFGLNSFLDIPPTFAVDILRTPLNENGDETGIGSIMPINNAGFGSFPAGTVDYANAAEGYNYLQGLWRDGSPLLDAGNGYNEGGDPTTIAFPGDPNETDNWSEINTNNPPGDRRALLSSNAFTFFPGAVNEFILAFSFARDSEANHLEQVNELRDRSDQLQGLFDNCFNIDEESAAFTGCNPLLTHLALDPVSSSVDWQVFPNPTQDFIKVELPIEFNDGTLTLFDATGRAVLSQFAKAGAQTLDIQHLPAGLYGLRLYSRNSILQTERVILQ